MSRGQHQLGLAVVFNKKSKKSFFQSYKDYHRVVERTTPIGFGGGF